MFLTPLLFIHSCRTFPRDSGSLPLSSVIQPHAKQPCQLFYFYGGCPPNPQPPYPRICGPAPDGTFTKGGFVPKAVRQLLALTLPAARWQTPQDPPRLSASASARTYPHASCADRLPPVLPLFLSPGVHLVFEIPVSARLVCRQRQQDIFSLFK